MPIVPTDVPMTAALCSQTVDRLCRTYPAIRCGTLTTTAFGRPVRTMVLGRGERQVIFAAAFHANEWITAPVLLKFTEELARAQATGGKLFGVPGDTIFRAATMHIIPMVNPDGVDLVTGGIPAGNLEYEKARRMAEFYPQIPFPEGWKANLLGVDLNLQFPALWLRAREIKFAQGFTQPGPRDYVGRAPLSQRESRAVSQYTEEVNPALILAFHTQGQVIYWKFQDYEVSGARALGEEFARLSGYELADVPYNSGFAGYKDWFIQNFRKPGFTIEAGLAPVTISQFDQIYRNVLGILVTAATGLAE